MHKIKFNIAILIFIAQSSISMAQQQNNTYVSFSKNERELIGNSAEKMEVYQTTDEKQLHVLQQPSDTVDPKDPLLAILAKRMLATVQDEAHPGVGIAAPQVGINKKLIWVQRFDKSGQPFEAYVNPKIVWRSTLIRTGAEGCLSIPDRREEVERNYAIRIQYANLNGEQKEENVEGFTAVVFQHEIDHLLGILFPDRLDEQKTNPSQPIVSNPKFSAKENAPRL